MGTVPHWQVTGEGIPSPKVLCAPHQHCPFIPTTVQGHWQEHHPPCTGGEERQTKNIPSVQLEEGSAQPLQAFAQKFCSQKENLLLDFSSILEMTGFIKNKERKSPNVH